MTKIIKFLRPLGLASVTVAASCFVFQSAPAQSVELVTNGNFQTVANPISLGFPGVANSTGWTTTGATSIIPVSTLTAGANPLIASAAAGFGFVATVGTVPASVPSGGTFAPTANGTWSYDLVTNPGSTYALSYNFANYSFLTNTVSQADQSFQVTRNGSVIAGTLLSGDVLSTSLSPTNATFIGTGNDVISFVFTGVTASAIDNVSVIGDAPRSVPEPFTIVGTLMGGAVASRMRKRYNATNKI